MTKGPDQLRRVLVVDDEPDLRFVVRRLLTQDGWVVVGEASDGFAAIEQARALRPDVILLDLSMPRMGGDKALPLLVEAVPDAVVVVFSASDVGSRESELRALGAAACYEKTRVRDLSDLLAEELAGHDGRDRTAGDGPVVRGTERQALGSDVGSS